MFAACALALAACARARQGSDAPASILRASGDSVHVRLFDAKTAQPIPNADVELQSDNGVRCIKAPCPTNGSSWKGSSDASGRLVIPKSALNTVANISSGRYHGDLVGDASPGAKGEWKVELFLEDTGDPGPRPLKLIDARTHEAIANSTVRIAPRDGGATDSVSATTNALGYVFVPFTIVAKHADSLWLAAPGYRDAKIDFSWAQRRMLMVRR
jgi:hypothetical protein